MIKELKRKIEFLKLNKYISDFRNNIPSQYNKVKLLDYLFNKEVDHYISISNRADGKTFNYINFFLKLARYYDIKFILLSRNFTVRNSYCEIVNNIMNTDEEFNIQLLEFNTTQFYRTIIYNKKILGIVTDLNEATNLKYFSQFLKNYDVIIYDEFLAIESDYLIDEWERLKTIYSSVDRNFNDDRILTHPKLFYLGNAVNFSSPILSNLKLYEVLEHHNINTCKQYGNIALEINVNENINSKRNLRAFSENDDDITYANFNKNKHNIINELTYKNLQLSAFNVKLNNNYLKIEHDEKNIIISIIANEKKYIYNTELKDNKSDSVFLNEKFYNNNFYKKYEKSLILFKNEYSRDYILSDLKLKSLNIFKLIKLKKQDFNTDDVIEEIQNEEKIFKMDILFNKIFNKK